MADDPAGVKVVVVDVQGSDFESTDPDVFSQEAGDAGRIPQDTCPVTDSSPAQHKYAAVD